MSVGDLTLNGSKTERKKKGWVLKADLQVSGVGGGWNWGGFNFLEIEGDIDYWKQLLEDYWSWELGEELEDKNDN